jgi:excisionase family DNA binding protein
MILPTGIAEVTTVTLADRYFDLQGLAVYSALSVQTLRSHIKKNHLPCFKVDGKILVKRSEFDRWLEAYRMNQDQDIDRKVAEILTAFKRKSES